MWQDATWHGMAWYDTIWKDVKWYDTTCMNMLAMQVAEKVIAKKSRE